MTSKNYKSEHTTALFEATNVMPRQAQGAGTHWMLTIPHRDFTPFRPTVFF